MGWTSTEDEVNEFLNELKRILCTGKVTIVKEHCIGDKTNEFMIVNNITRRIVVDELLKLDILNYAYTDYDNNPIFSDELVWIFGQMYNSYEVYIKLKIRPNSRVICLSFHEKEFDLRYPYL